MARPPRPSSYEVWEDLRKRLLRVLWRQQGQQAGKAFPPLRLLRKSLRAAALTDMSIEPDERSLNQEREDEQCRISAKAVARVLWNNLSFRLTEQELAYIAQAFPASEIQEKARALNAECWTEVGCRWNETFGARRRDGAAAKTSRKEEEDPMDTNDLDDVRPNGTVKGDGVIDGDRFVDALRGCVSVGKTEYFTRCYWKIVKEESAQREKGIPIASVMNRMRCDWLPQVRRAEIPERELWEMLLSSLPMVRKYEVVPLVAFLRLCSDLTNHIDRLFPEIPEVMENFFGVRLSLSEKDRRAWSEGPLV